MECMFFFFFFFFFKQKTAYEIMPSLVGSEMCIRDRYTPVKARYFPLTVCRPLFLRSLQFRDLGALTPTFAEQFFRVTEAGRGLADLVEQLRRLLGIALFQMDHGSMILEDQPGLVGDIRQVYGVIELPGRQFGQSQMNECKGHGQVEPWVSSASNGAGTHRDRLFVTTARESAPRRHQALLDRTGCDAGRLGGYFVHQAFDIGRNQLRQRGRVGDEVIVAGCKNGLQSTLHGVGISGMSTDGGNKEPCGGIVNPKLFGRQTQPISALEVHGDETGKFLQQEPALRNLRPVVHQVLEEIGCIARIVLPGHEPHQFRELGHVGGPQDKQGLEDLPPNRPVDGVRQHATQDTRLLHTERDTLEQAIVVQECGFIDSGTPQPFDDRSLQRRGLRHVRALGDAVDQRIQDTQFRGSGKDLLHTGVVDQAVLQDRNKLAHDAPDLAHHAQFLPHIRCNVAALEELLLERGDIASYVREELGMVRQVGGIVRQLVSVLEHCLVDDACTHEVLAAATKLGVLDQLVDRITEGPDMSKAPALEAAIVERLGRTGVDESTFLNNDGLFHRVTLGVEKAAILRRVLANAVNPTVRRKVLQCLLVLGTPNMAEFSELVGLMAMEHDTSNTAYLIQYLVDHRPEVAEGRFLLEKLARLVPMDFESRYGLGLAAEQLGVHDTAAGYFVAAIRAHPGDPDTVHHALEAILASGDYDLIADATSLSQLSPVDVEGLVDKAAAETSGITAGSVEQRLVSVWAAFAGSRYEEAVAMSSGTVRGGGDQRFYLPMALAFVHLGLPELATRELDHAIHLPNVTDEARLALKYHAAVIHLEQGNTQQAAQLFHEVGEASPGFRDTEELLSKCGSQGSKIAKL